MGGMLLPQEVIEHVLQFVDGKTLLTCKEVSPEFAAAVKYLSNATNIWEKCYRQEKGDKYPYSIISTLHPHKEGFDHPKKWALIYEASSLSSFLSLEHEPRVEVFKLCKDYASILDMVTHDNLIIVLVKYNKEFSIYHRLITINLENFVVDKSCRFFANMLYITPIDDTSKLKRDSIVLYCELCQLVAIPINADTSTTGYPKFRKNDSFLTVEHSNGHFLWINTFGNIITKGKCFHTGTTTSNKEIKVKDSKTVRVHHRFTTLFMSCGKTIREFNTFKELRAGITASLVYSDVLIVGTDTGVLYAYSFTDEAAIKKLSLKNYIWKFSACDESILVISVMELKSEFVVVCCSERNVYHVHLERKKRAQVCR